MQVKHNNCFKPLRIAPMVSKQTAWKGVGFFFAEYAQWSNRVTVQSWGV